MSSAAALTPIQARIRRFIEDFAQQSGHSPTYRDIASAVGLASLSSVSLHVRTLRRRATCSASRDGRGPWWSSRVTRCGSAGAHRGRCRAGHRRPRDAAYVRLAGQIAAGEPILSGEQVLSADSADDAFVLPRQLVGEGELFMLRVSGESMIGAGITDGDLVVIRERPDAENGDIVAALIDGVEVEGTARGSSGQTGTPG